MSDKLVENRTLTGLVSWMNERFSCKESGSKFTVQDLQNYVRRGYIPKYLGGNLIVPGDAMRDVKLYNILK